MQRARSRAAVGGAWQRHDRRLMRRRWWAALPRDTALRRLPQRARPASTLGAARVAPAERGRARLQRGPGRSARVRRPRAMCPGSSGRESSGSRTVQGVAVGAVLAHPDAGSVAAPRCRTRSRPGRRRPPRARSSPSPSPPHYHHYASPRRQEPPRGGASQGAEAAALNEVRGVGLRLIPGWHDGAKGVGCVRRVPGGGGSPVRVRDSGRGDAGSERVVGRFFDSVRARPPRTGRRVYGRRLRPPDRQSGCCLGTLGPGATNLVTAVADAFLDRAPLVALTGQSDLERMHKESHQYIDLIGILRPIVSGTRGCPAQRSYPRSYARHSRSPSPRSRGRPIWSCPRTCRAAARRHPLPGARRCSPSPGASELQRATEFIDAAENPIALAGNGAIRAHASRALRAFVADDRDPGRRDVHGQGSARLRRPEGARHRRLAVTRLRVGGVRERRPRDRGRL